MFKRRRLLLALVLCSADLVGQVSFNAVTVTVSRNPDVQADQAVFGVSVDSDMDKNLDDVVGALAGSGITSANFTGIHTVWGNLGTPGSSARLAWTFQLSVPVSRIKETTLALTALQQSVAQKGSGLLVSFQVRGLLASSQVQNCDLPALVADARVQAQKLAGAGGLSPGNILAITSATSNSLAAACWMTVRFALGLMFGSTDPNTITITASRSATATPDQAAISILLNSGLTAGRDEIVSALEGAGVKGAVLEYVDTTTSYSAGTQTPVGLEWSFALAAPLSKLKETLALLSAARDTMAKAGGGLSLTFSVSGVQVSPESQNAQACSQADLITDARAQAEKVAAAAGVSAGPIMGLARGQSTVLDPGNVIPVSRAGNFSFLASTFVSPIGTQGATFLLGLPAGLNFSAPSSCSATVQFQLLRR